MKLKELRKSYNLNQQEVAGIVGTTQSNYGKYELGITQPDINTLCKLADYYGVTLDYLCDHKTEQLQLPPLTEDKKKVFETILQLDRDNFGILYGFVMGLFEKQNKK